MHIPFVTIQLADLKGGLWNSACGVAYCCFGYGVALVVNKAAHYLFGLQLETQQKAFKEGRLNNTSWGIRLGSAVVGGVACYALMPHRTLALTHFSGRKALEGLVMSYILGVSCQVIFKKFQGRFPALEKIGKELPVQPLSPLATGLPGITSGWLGQSAIVIWTTMGCCRGAMR
jgi:hypothetical protein